MLYLSNLIIQNPEVNSFDGLVGLVREAARRGERFLNFDVKPDYRDTPRNWEIKLETAFYWSDK